MHSLETSLREKLSERKKLNRYRSRISLESAQAESITLNGKKYLNFCSNDYLGLANHPRLVEAQNRAAEFYGTGSGASHLVCGHSREHHQLEEELAEFTGRERVLLFSTGYMANLGVISALTDRHDTIFQDKLNHASLLDGGMLSRAALQRYRHGDTAHLDTLLSASSAKNNLIVSDGVFSMDGDIAPLDRLSSLSAKHDAWLMVDDAHGFGVLGEKGEGAAGLFGLTQTQLPILVGTLGKAFGTFGAFVAGSEELIETLIQFSRSYIYTTAMPPSVAAASRESLKLVVDEVWRREQLDINIRYFKHACEAQELDLLESDTPIQPLIVGDDARAVRISEFLYRNGVLISAIRPPTVPEGTARLRITLSSEHQREQIDQLVELLSAAVTDGSDKTHDRD